jgi:hypothetical protein
MSGSDIFLGPFRVNRAGQLTLRDPALTPAIRFTWRGRHCGARIAEGGIGFWATLGRVPSTLARAQARESIFATLRALPKALPPGWAMRLSPDHRVLAETTVIFPGPLTATSLIAPITSALLTLAPYLDLLEEDGLEVPGWARSVN